MRHTIAVAGRLLEARVREKEMLEGKEFIPSVLSLENWCDDLKTKRETGGGREGERGERQSQTERQRQTDRKRERERERESHVQFFFFFFFFFWMLLSG